MTSLSNYTKFLLFLILLSSSSSVFSQVNLSQYGYPFELDIPVDSEITMGILGLNIKHSDGYEITFETHNNNSESVSERIAELKKEQLSQDLFPVKNFEIENECGFLHSFGKSKTWYQFRAVLNFNTVKYIARFFGPNSEDLNQIKMNFDAVCSAKYVPETVVIDSLVLEQYNLVVPVPEGAKLDDQWSDSDGSEIIFDEDLRLAFSKHNYEALSAEESVSSLKSVYITDNFAEYILETSDSFIMRTEDTWGESKYSMVHVKVENGMTYTFSDNLDLTCEADARFLLECAQNSRVILPPPPEPLSKKDKLKVIGLYGAAAVGIILGYVVLGGSN